MSTVHVAGEYRLVEGPDGGYYAESVFGHAFWTRYLEVFDRVVVVARTQASEHVDGMLRVDGDRVSVHPMPYYVGVAGMLKAYPALRSAARDVAAQEGHFILRLPGVIGGLVASALPRGRAYGVELVGDPADVLSQGGVDHPLRRVMQVKAVRDLRRQCRRAAAVAYVSRYQLEPRYPAGHSAATFAYSSATMPDEAFAEAPRHYSKPLRHIVAIGSMEQTYKGFDVLVEAFGLLANRYPDLSLTVVGEGRRRPEIEAQAEAAGLTGRITFTGALATPAEVRAVLDAGDLFVSSSRTEGLPRTVIEAQARGIAAVGTDVGGTPELLREEDMCSSDDAPELARLIEKYLDSPQLADENADLGLQSAQRYATDKLQGERNAMFGLLLGGDLA